MTKEDQISNKEIQTQKTGEEFFIPEEKTSTETPSNLPEPTVVSSTSEQSFKKNLTPVEVAQKKHYEKEADKNDRLGKLYKTLEVCAKGLSWVIGVVIAVFAAYWAYNLSSISEPIGALKENIKNNNETSKETENRIRVLEDKLTETREEFIRGTK